MLAIYGIGLMFVAFWGIQEGLGGATLAAGFCLVVYQISRWAMGAAKRFFTKFSNNYEGHFDLSFLLTLEGRISRSHYLFGMALWHATAFLVVIALTNDWGDRLTGTQVLFIYVPFAALTIPLIVKRLHDLDMSLWWIAALPVPLVGLIVGVNMLFVRGTSRDTKNGPLSPPIFLKRKTLSHDKDRVAA